MSLCLYNHSLYYALVYASQNDGFRLELEKIIKFYITTITASRQWQVMEDLWKVFDILSYEIATYLDGESLAKTSCINRQWRQIGESSELWNALCLNTFGLNPAAFTVPLSKEKRIRRRRARSRSSSLGSLDGSESECEIEEDEETKIRSPKEFFILNHLKLKEVLSPPTLALNSFNRNLVIGWRLR